MTEKILTIGRPNPRQREFLACEKKYVAFGGARGGGKSWAVRTKAKLLALRYPGIRLLLVRRTYQELEANHIRFLRRELANLAEYRATARQFAFPNGSVLDFGYCAADGDMDRYQGAEYDVIFLDEATQLKEEWMRQFAACLRGVNGFPKRLYYTCNPGGPGHGYIKRLFICVPGACQSGTVLAGVSKSAAVLSGYDSPGDRADRRYGFRITETHWDTPV